jgi:hypothetical protein
MPHIIVVADRAQDQAGDAVMLRERISASDLASHHFGERLLERLEWAVGDAHEAELACGDAPRRPATESGDDQAGLSPRQLAAMAASRN